MNIIFLDIDGPLCNHLTGFNENKMNPINIYSINLLNELCTECNAQIVISSSWRKLFSKNEILNHLRNNNFNGHFHTDWMTPILNKQRGYEVDKWITNNKFTNKYICIDDDSDYLPHQPLCLVDSYDGFGFKDFLLCKSILQNSKNKLISKLYKNHINKINKNLSSIL